MIVRNKPTITRKELEGVLDCLINNELITGGTVKKFESCISTLLNQKYALATSSLTASFHLIFCALEIEEDSEVILPSFMDQAALNALILKGGTPVLVDSDENSLFPSIDQIKTKITEKTSAIVAAHTFGYQYDTEELKKLNIPIIEDISDILGTEINEEKPGTDATFTVASFDPSKILTTGNGSMVLTSNSRHYSLMRDLRNSAGKGIHFDYSMTDLQGAMGLSQMMRINDFIVRRKKIAASYIEALKMTEHKTIYPHNEAFTYQCFPVFFDAPQEKISKYWKKKGIETLPAMPAPLHNLMGLRGLDFPMSDRMSKKLYSVPLYPTLTKNEIEKISKALAGFI